MLSLSINYRVGFDFIKEKRRPTTVAICNFSFTGETTYAYKLELTAA